MKVDLHPDAFALRPVRFLPRENKIRFYTGVTFPGSEWVGCELQLRRCKAFGYLVEDSDVMIDVLNENGDIIQEFPISKKGFEYLREKLKFRVDE
jgi:hypothetical protein